MQLFIQNFGCKAMEDLRRMMMKLKLWIMVMMVLMAFMASAERVPGIPICCTYDRECCNRCLNGLAAKP